MLLIFRNSAMTHMIRYSIRSLDFIFDMGNKIHLLLNFVLSSFLSFSLYIKFHTSTFFAFGNSSSIYILVPLFPKFVTYLFLIQIHTHTYKTICFHYMYICLWLETWNWIYISSLITDSTFITQYFLYHFIWPY